MVVQSRVGYTNSTPLFDIIQHYSIMLELIWPLCGIVLKLVNEFNLVVDTSEKKKIWMVLDRKFDGNTI